MTCDSVPASRRLGGIPELMSSQQLTSAWTASGKPWDSVAALAPEDPELVRSDPAGLTSVVSEGSGARWCAIVSCSVLSSAQREHLWAAGAHGS